MLNILIFFVLNCFSPGVPAADAVEPIVIEGQTMGTTYRIIYFDNPKQRDFSAEVDSLLRLVNKSINVYDPDSEISRFNKSDWGVCLRRPYLYEILVEAKEIYKASGGAFDPTVMPLVNAWGFGPAEKIGQPNIDSLKELTGFNRVRISKKRIRKTDPRLQLDLGGIGQGYGADVVFRFLRSQGITDMLVELGGEGVALGKNLQKNKAWTIGILDPNSTPYHQYFKAYVTLEDRAFTTSGNYFNYKIIDGRKFGHTIDPDTGRPVQHSLLSASVFADDCATADGWATAFMVMGVEKAVEILENLKGIDVVFLYSNESDGLETYVSPAMEKHVTLE